MQTPGMIPGQGSLGKARVKPSADGAPESIKSGNIKGWCWSGCFMLLVLPPPNPALLAKTSLECGSRARLQLGQKCPEICPKYENWEWCERRKAVRRKAVGDGDGLIPRGEKKSLVSLPLPLAGHKSMVLAPPASPAGTGRYLSCHPFARRHSLLQRHDPSHEQGTHQAPASC